MPVTVLVADDFERMSEAAAEIVKKDIVRTIRKKGECILGLATGNSPTGLYKHLAKAANKGEFDSGRVRSFNLDEYVGLPGENVQQRVMHPQSFCYFMIQELFGLLEKKFSETSLPYGSLIDQKRLIKELQAHPGDWEEQGREAGKSIVIRPKPSSPYLGWIKTDILDGYSRKVKRAGGIDLQIIGVGGRGHAAFHESGIPFKNSRVLLVRPDQNTVANAVADGHFKSEKEVPRYAVSMGAELIYKARTVVLLANGERKIKPVADSLLGEVTPDVPISYGQLYAQRGGHLVYILDKTAARELLAHKDILKEKGIEIRTETQAFPGTS